MSVERLIARARELSMPAVAMTDLNNLFGAIDFYRTARAAGVKPILGCEILYSTRASRLDAPQGRTVAPPGAGPPVPSVHHLVVLCKNLQGYRNLCQLVTRAYTEAPPPTQGAASTAARAVVDRAALERWGDGLIVLSGCLRGELATKLLFGREAEALEALHWFHKRFGEDFYLELVDSGLPEQEQVNETLFAWGLKYGVKAVATADCHYLEPGDAEAHEVLCCIEHGKNLDLDRPRSLVPAEAYLKSADLMRERFQRFPGACDATAEIAGKCDLEFRFKDDQGRAICHLPNFRPDGVAKSDPFDVHAFFRAEARQGLAKRFASYAFEAKRARVEPGGSRAEEWLELETAYRARLEDELTMIERTGFAAYFLIVSDFIRWAKERGIPVGPGRGSGAGSLVAYALGITDIDPIAHKLLFERFINPERISLPDFDVDFCQDRRGEVIDYVRGKYGAENVCQIITYNKLQARAALRDVGRVLGLSFAESDQLTKLMPEELGITIAEALEKEPRLRAKMDAEPRMAKVVEYALKLEGLYRNAGIHAAGVIITEEPVVSYCPLYVGRDGDIVTQFDKDSAEAIGLVKFDFLGLKTLTVIDHAVKQIRAGATPGTPAAGFSLEKLDRSDPRSFELISSGDTDGVFQVESSGMKDLCSRIVPGSLEDITAINALYRPGPLGSGMVDDFIDRKHGRKPIVYDDPSLEPILRETYGVILSQEQVMQIARELAGYSLGQADLLRRAMGKKKPEEMAQHREIFMKGAVTRGLAAEKAAGIFDLMAKFAEYGFNKSHSAAYGELTYQTAYLKAHHPAEFLAALMTTEMDNTDKLTRYIGDARAHGIAVLPPSVNASQRRFSVERVDGVAAIRFGLEAIKGVGSIAVDAILEARDAEGAFKGVLDFSRRVPTRKVNKKVLESLTLSGSFDSIAEVNRASLFASLESLLEVAGDEQEEKELGQSSLFDAFTADQVKLVTPASAVFKTEEEWPRSRCLMLERQVVGFYVSGHPMDPWQKICEEWLGWSVERLKKTGEERAAQLAAAARAAGPEMRNRPKADVRIAGILSELREVMTKKGARMAFGFVEDLSGRVEVGLPSDMYLDPGNQEILKRTAQEAEPVVLSAEAQFRDDGMKVWAKSLEWVGEAHRNRVQQVVLRLSTSAVKPEQIRELKKCLLDSRGKCAVRIDFVGTGFQTRMELPKHVRVAATPQFVESVNRLFGADVVSLI